MREFDTFYQFREIGFTCVHEISSKLMKHNIILSLTRLVSLSITEKDVDLALQLLSRTVAKTINIFFHQVADVKRLLPLFFLKRLKESLKVEVKTKLKDLTRTEIKILLKYPQVFSLLDLYRQPNITLAITTVEKVFLKSRNLVTIYERN